MAIIERNGVNGYKQRNMKSSPRVPAIMITLIVIAASMVAIGMMTESVSGALFFVPFVTGPLWVSLFMAFLVSSKSQGILLTVASVLYGAWFAMVYASVVYWQSAPVDPVAFVFIGIFSLPVLIPMWLAMLYLRRRQQREGEGRHRGETPSAPPEI